VKKLGTIVIKQYEFQGPICIRNGFMSISQMLFIFGIL
jgi:hypothetical protein